MAFDFTAPSVRADAIDHARASEYFTGARTADTYDAATSDNVHPLLNGLLLNSLSQCFAYPAINRRVPDLAERVITSHGVLAGANAPLALRRSASDLGNHQSINPAKASVK
jgi:hypothetical protein